MDYYRVGLTDDEVIDRRNRYGWNLLTPPKRPSLWKLYFEKFQDEVVQGITCHNSFFPRYFYYRK